MSLRRKLYYGITLAVVAVLMLLPATGWLARLQLLPFTLPGATPLFKEGLPSYVAREEKQMAEVLAHNKNDFALRFAHAMRTPADEKGDKTLSRLETLHADYPDNPVVIAAILKTMTRGAVKVRREEENLLSSPERRKTTTKYMSEKQDPAQLAKFIAFAETGEKLEPRNAYFPVMAAVGYFAAREDEKAIAAWVRAGNKTEWDEHQSEETFAVWKMRLSMDGGREQGALSRMATSAAVLFPQYAGIRATTRMASVSAFQAELRGEQEKGFIIRRATLRIGQRMQEESKTFIGNLVGQAVVAISASRAGGAEVASNPYKGEGASQRWIKERQVRYAEYLRSIGHQEESAAYTKSIADGVAQREMWKRASPKTYWGFEKKTYQLFGGWFASFLLIAGVLFSLVFAGIFKLVYKFSPRLQKGEPLQNSARWGVVSGILLPILAGGASLLAVSEWLGPEPGKELIAMTAVILALLVAVPPIFLRLSWREIGHGLLVMVGTWASFAALIGVGVLCFQFSRGITDSVGMFLESGDRDILKIITPWVIGSMVLSVPLGLLLLFGIFSKVLRVPFAAGVTRGMRAMAVPLACFLTLLWSGALLYTLGHERAAIHEMEQIAKIGEKQYMQQLK